MRKKAILLLSVSGIWAMTGLAQTAKDSTRVARSLTIDEVVVTGTRNETDVRHLPMTISVVNRKVLEQSFQPSVLPVLTEQVPGLFTTSRGIMGYGVSTGAAGGMSLRGIGGSPTAGLLVLIYNPQIHPFVFSKRNVRLWRGVPKTKRSIFEKIQMPFKQLSKSL